MSDEGIVVINGQRYDARSGLPVVEADSSEKSPQRQAEPKQPSPASHVHSPTQKSKTLHRKATKKPVTSRPPSSARRSMDIAKHPGVTKFSPQTPDLAQAAKTQTKPIAATPDIAPVAHPAVKKHAELRAVQKNPKPSAQKPAQQIKQEAIKEALAQPAHHHKKPGFFRRHRRVFSITTGVIALLVGIAYVAYLNMPGLSVRIASAQAGISASYPQYTPSGYSLRGAVNYGDGQVTMTFGANAGNTSYSVRQVKSSWDSNAVREMVERESDGQFITTLDRGLTVYTYSGNAAWVNGGILYTISGDTPLSSEQIVRIATSL